MSFDWNIILTDDIDVNAKIQEVNFTVDGFRLRGILHLPAEAERPPVIVGSHGLLADAESPKQIALARECNRLGIAFLRFDHRGCGGSEGDFREVTSLEARCKDLSAAVQTVLQHDDVGDRLGLFGSSMGGTTCLASAHRLPVGPMVVVAAPIHSQALHRASQALHDPLTGRPPYDVDKMRFDISERLGGIGNILIFHGDADETVPVAHGREIYEKALAPKRLIVQAGGDHLMSDPAHQKVFVRETVQWFASGLL